MHPLAWWAWALALAIAATRVAAGVLPVVLVAAVAVVLVRRDDSPWARAFGAYLVLAAAIVLLRIGFHIVFGIKTGAPVVLDLPRLTLPDWAVGVELFGPVTGTGLVSAAAEGLRLATLVVCFGAANALANPQRALRALPSSVHHLGTAVVIAVTVTPQLAAATANLRRSRRLRGSSGGGLRALRQLVVPVLTDGLDRSLALAAAMDSRGYGRTVGSDRRVFTLLLVALVAAAVGSYGLLAGPSPLPAAGLLLSGMGIAAGASWLAGRQVRRTRYRPETWQGAETTLVLTGLALAVLAVLGAPATVVLPAVAVAAVTAIAPGWGHP